MDKRKTKLIAPIAIAVLLILYFCMFSFGFFASDEPILMKIACGVIPLCLVGVTIFVLVERIDEINGGEEDDLSKY